MILFLWQGYSQIEVLIIGNVTNRYMNQKRHIDRYAFARRCLFALALILIFTKCQKPVNKASGAVKTPEVFQFIHPGNVKVAGEMGRRIDITLHGNIQKIDTDKDFILPFLRKTDNGGFTGIGMYIDALAKFAAYSNDNQIVAYKNYVIGQLISAQLPDGYAGALRPENRMWSLWDIHEMGYIIFGLTTDYEYFRNEKILQTAIKIADYILDRWSTMPQGWENGTRVNLHEAVTGLDRAMLALYHHTGQRRFLDFCVNQKALQDWNLDIEIGRRVGLDGHVYGYLGMCLAQLELFRLLPQEKLLKQSDKAMDFLTAKDGMVISGETGQWETWTDDQDGDHALGETCATAYQIRFYENLLRLTGKSEYGDLMERTIYNALFAAQSPDGRRIRYYTPMGGTREYFKDDTYCCPNNYRRIISELPSMIYYKSQSGGIGINLYTASSATISLSDGTSVNLKQETDYPNSGKVEITVSSSQSDSFPLMLRVPAWAKRATVTINGEVQKLNAIPGNNVIINRQWSKGDKVLLDIPMDWRLVKGRKRQSGRVAVMRGPILFCLTPEKNQGQGLDQLTSYDLGRILLDFSSLKGPFIDESIRPGGMSCKIGGWKEGHGMSDGPHDYELLFTEFPDPGCQATYFSIADMGIAVDDELLKFNK